MSTKPTGLRMNKIGLRRKAESAFVEMEAEKERERLEKLNRARISREARKEQILAEGREWLFERLGVQSEEWFWVDDEGWFWVDEAGAQPEDILPKGAWIFVSDDVYLRFKPLNTPAYPAHVTVVDKCPYEDCGLWQPRTGSSQKSLADVGTALQLNPYTPGSWLDRHYRYAHDMPLPNMPLPIEE